MNEISAPGIIAETFRVYKNNFKAVFLTSLVIAGVASVAGGAIVVFFDDGIIAPLVSAIIYIVGALFLAGFLVHVVDEYRKGNSIEPKELLGKTRPVILNLFLNGVIRGALVAIGLILIAPGVFLAIVFAVSSAAVVDDKERKGPLKALSRSAELTKGNRGSIFGVYILLYLLVIACYIVGGSIAMTLGAIVAGLLDFVAISVLAVIVIAVPYTIILSFVGLLEGVLFYELRDGSK